MKGLIRLVGFLIEFRYVQNSLRDDTSLAGKKIIVMFYSLYIFGPHF